MKKKLLSLILTAVLLATFIPSFTLSASAADGTTWDGISVATAFASGTGMETDPYIIETAGQLIFLRNQVNSGNSYDGIRFRLDADLDMAGKTFGDAIGTGSTNQFNGHLDGNGHKISNLTIGNANGYSALFGNVGWSDQEVVIKDLTLDNVKVDRTSTSYGAAALVGNAGYLKLEKCTIESGTVQTKSYTAGGFVANAGSSSAIGLSIIDCVNKADISQTGDTGNGAGGIVGQGCFGGTTITGCINYGDVSGRSYAAGIVGNAFADTVEKCANYGNISATGTSSGTYAKTAKAAGILVSERDMVTSIENCYNVGNISSNGTTAYGSATKNAGGAAGIAAFNSSSSVQKTIIGCHNVGTVTGDYGYPIALRSTSIQNAFYLNTSSKNNSAAIQKTAEEFADGTVLALLNADITDEAAPWEQGSDYPVLKRASTTPTPSVPTYTVTVSDTIENGTVEADVSEAYEGDTVTLTVTPRENYEIDTVSYNDGTSDVDITATEGVYSFTMPAGDVIVTATFKEIAAPITFEGAQIRTHGEQGLRFIFSMDKEYYDTLTHPESYAQTGEGFGGIVLPTDLLGDEKLTKDIEKVAIVPSVVLYEITDTTVKYTVCLTGISDYQREYTVRSYVTDANGVSIYGESGEAISVFEIAELAYASENESEETRQYLLENVLNKVDPEKYPIA